MLAVNGGYYLGTRRGLYFFSKDKSTLSIKKIIPALQDREIRTLFRDASNAIWIVTKSRLHRYFPETRRLSTYSHSENVRGNSYFANGYLRKKDGQVFLGATGGINSFYPEKIDIYPGELYPYIREVTIREFTDSISSFSGIRRLNRHQNTINFGFSTPYYGNPDHITYRYQLTENGQWFNLGDQSSLILWGLPPGDYHFRIAATLYDGVWHTSQDSFRFSIPPPFWKTWWFTVTMILLGCGVLYGIIVFFQRKLKTERLLKIFATSLYGRHTVEDILWETAGNCVQHLQVSDCVIYELDRKKQCLLQKATAGDESPYNMETANTKEIPLSTGILGTVVASGKAARIGKRAEGLREIAAPIKIEGEVFGVIAAQLPKIHFYKNYHLRMLEKIADLCADRIRKYLTEEKLRGKIARDLHDEMGSTLTSIHIISKITEQDLRDNAPARKQLAKIKHHTSGMMEKMSDMVWVVNPANDGLDKLMYRIREYGVEVLEPQNIDLSFKEVEHAQNIKLNPGQRKNIYLIAKEALNNAVKYSDASKVGIHFKAENGLLQMHVLDNGRGYDPAVSHSGNGLKNMRIRSEEIGATLNIETAPGKGVLLLLSLRVERTQPA